MRARLPSIAVVLAVAALAGCGADAPSSADFVGRVADACRQANERLDRLPAPSPTAADGPSAEQLAGYLRDALAINRAAADEIRALPIPEAFRPERDRLVEAMDEANEGLESVAQAAEAGDETAMTDALARLAAARTAFQDAARALGVNGCDPSASIGSTQKSRE